MVSRVVRGLIVLLAASLLGPVFAVSLAQPAVLHHAQGLRDGLPTGPVFIDADGVTSAVLAQVQSGAVGAGSQLVLERLMIAPNDTLDAVVTEESEILLVREGAVSITDSFGFSATTPAGQALTFAPGSSYALANTGGTPAVVLRLAMAATPTDATGGETAPAGSPEAVPAAETLLSHPIDAPSGPVTLFLADAVFEPGSASGVLEHDGPLGMVIESGTLDVLSPSGLTGQLQEGAAVVLPSTAPLVASNNGATDAEVLFAGVVAAGETLVTEITPTPAPTAIPTATPTPSPTPEPTVPPTPTPIPTTESGMTLAAGETWIADDAYVALELEVDDWSGDILVHVTYSNRTSERADFPAYPATLQVFDDLGVFWEFGYSDNDLPARVIVEAGQSATYTRAFESPEGTDYVADVYVVVSRMGGVSLGQWGFTYNRGAILESPAAGQNVTSGTAPYDLGSFMPAASALPTRFQEPIIVNRTVEWVSLAYSERLDATMDQFLAWGWLGNTTATYDYPGGFESAGTGEVNYATISIYQFSDSANTAPAFQYIANDLAQDGWTLTSQYDDGSAVLQEFEAETSDGEPVSGVLADFGEFVIIVRVWANDMDPSPTALAVYDLVVDRIEARSG